MLLSAIYKFMWPLLNPGTMKKDKKDNQIIWSLVNWGYFVRQGMDVIPPADPRGASWHQQVDDKYPDDTDQPFDVDEDAAERTQHAMVRCMIHDMETAMLLTKHYRDGWAVANIRKARNKFWRFL